MLLLQERPLPAFARWRDGVRRGVARAVAPPRGAARSRSAPRPSAPASPH